MSKAKSRIRSGDTVVVIAGKNKGTRGRVLRVNPEDRKVVVEGVNRVKRHQKPVGEQPGGILEKEMPIHISNVALWVGGADGHKAKVGFSMKDGKKVRMDRGTGNLIDNA
ncbi:MAG: 50S ribosomal protein L24 [Myxococcota bacterium]